MMEAANAKKLDDLYELREVRGKRVFVVDDHHKALAAWSVVRRERQDAPILITFDHHTDTHEAFLGAASESRASERSGYDHEVMESERAKMVKILGWKTDDEVLASVAQLRHDEHIDAAAECGILRASFSIQLSDSGGTPSKEEAAYAAKRSAAYPVPLGEGPPEPPFTFAASNNVFVVGHDCFIGCEAKPHTETCLNVHYSQVLETVYVEDQLARAATMARCIGIEGGLESVPYILDVDLDVFHTAASIAPQDASAFHRLVRGAVAITIATEPSCVKELWRDKNVLTADDLLERLLGHIDLALA